MVRVSVVSLPTKVSVAVGKVSVPVLEIVEITGEVKVLLVSVSAVARPTRVSVAVGKVKVPVFEIVEMTGVVKVLFVKVCVPVNVATVESIEIVPVEVTGPPVNPVPVLTCVTVPAEALPQAGLAPAPPVCRTCPAVPAGKRVQLVALR